MRFYGWIYIKSQCERTSLYIATCDMTFIMQSVAFIASTSQDRIKLIFSTLIDHTYLESNFYCLQQ